MVSQRLDTQLLVGDGNAPNLEGIVERSGIQTQAKGSDPTPDAIYKGMQKIRSIAFEEPTGVVLHPDDWTPIRLLRTADGIYIWGSPSEPGPERIWGLPVVQTAAMTADTGLVGAFYLAEFAVRKGVDVQVGLIDDYFIKNRQAVREEMRGALQVYKPAAFCTVTGI
jgi:HK97 family phage major capsid protein